MAPAELVGAMGGAARLAEFAGAFIIVVALYKGLVALERRGHRAELLTAVVGLLLFEGVLWDQDSVPRGIFHPILAGQNFRLYDVLIPVALAARWRVSGLPRRVSLLGGIVLAFCAWYGAEAVVGEMRGYGFAAVLYEAKLIIYLGGGYALASGVRAADILGPHGIRRLARPFAVVTVLLLVLSGGRGIDIPIPTLRADGVGGVQPDVATLLMGLGLITLLVELSQPRRSLSMGLAGFVLLIAPVGAHQRASLIALLVAVAAFLLAWLVRVRWTRRLRLTPTEVILSVVVLIASISSYALVRGRSPFTLKSLPLGRQLASTFKSTAKTQSAADRVAQYHAALPYIHQHLAMGWGLGIPSTYTTSQGATLVITSPDDVYVSLALRTGLFGLALFVVMIAGATVLGYRAWRNCPDGRVAALAWGAAAFALAIAARGSVEGIFEKYRLAVALGLALGILRSATNAWLQGRATPPAAPEVLPTAPDRVGSAEPAGREPAWGRAATRAIGSLAV